MTQTYSKKHRVWTDLAAPDPREQEMSELAETLEIKCPSSLLRDISAQD
jgi:hypothetical protein